MTELPSVQVTGGKTLRVSGNRFRGVEIGESRRVRPRGGSRAKAPRRSTAPCFWRSQDRVPCRPKRGFESPPPGNRVRTPSRAVLPESRAPIGHRHDERFFFRGQPNLGRACIGSGVREKVFHTAFETQRSCRQNARLGIRFQCGIAFEGHGAPEVRVVVR